MRKRTIWILVGVLLFLYVSVMNVLMSWRNPLVELLEFYFAMIISVLFIYGLVVACKMEMRLGRFQYQGKKAVWVGLAIAGSAWAFGVLVLLLLEMAIEALSR